jgi:hypothetical protein
MMSNFAVWLDSNVLVALERGFLRGVERLLDMYLAHQKKQKAAAALRKLERTALDRNAQCFACGHRDGEISYDPTIQRVVHHCKVCGAVRPELPVYPVKAWDFLGRDLRVNKERELEVMQRFNGGNIAQLQAEAAEKKAAEKKVEMVH